MYNKETPDMLPFQSIQPQRTAIIKALLFCTLFTLLLFGMSFLKPMFPAAWERAVYGGVGTVAAVIATLIFLYYDQLSFSDIGWKLQPVTISNFGIGFLIGLLCMGLLTGAVIIGSGFQVRFNEHQQVLRFIRMTLPLIPLAFFEEAAFRGYPLRTLQQRMNLRGTLLWTSLFFALYHIASGWGIQQALLGPGVWGILFGLAAFHSNGISMPTGLHYGVNLTTAAFGIDQQTNPLWILTQSNGDSLATYQSSPWEVLLPQLALLLIAVIGMEYTMRLSKTKIINPA
jgi:hypothetical protein